MSSDDPVKKTRKTETKEKVNSPLKILFGTEFRFGPSPTLGSEEKSLGRVAVGRAKSEVSRAGGWASPSALEDTHA